MVANAGRFRAAAAQCFETLPRLTYDGATGHRVTRARFQTRRAHTQTTPLSRPKTASPLEVKARRSRDVCGPVMLAFAPLPPPPASLLLQRENTDVLKDRVVISRAANLSLLILVSTQLSTRPLVRFFLRRSTVDLSPFRTPPN